MFEKNPELGRIYQQLLVVQQLLALYRAPAKEEELILRVANPVYGQGEEQEVAYLERLLEK
jgi:hypothetical protein